MATSSTPRPLALSPSRASDYKQCPLLYRFRAIDKLPEPKTIAQVKGTLVHAVLEEMHKLPRAERTYPAAVKMIKPSWADMTAKDAELLELGDVGLVVRRHMRDDDPVAVQIGAADLLDAREVLALDLAELGDEFQLMSALRQD